jgi:hypothetical protein
MSSSTDGNDPGAELRRLVDDIRRKDEAGARSRRRWLRFQAEEEAEFAGTLKDLLERGSPVQLTTETGRRHEGWLRGLARDVCALERADGRRIWLRTASIAAVRPGPALDHGPTMDARSDREDLDLVEVLGRLAEERPLVQIVLRAGAGSVTGLLRAVGADVVTLLEGERRTACYVRVPSIVELSLLGSG